jgi:sugar/nucleoside kinase (ribokinase family)
MVQVHKTGDAAIAVDFANRVAACSVERLGAIPTCMEALARFEKLNL